MLVTNFHLGDHWGFLSPGTFNNVLCPVSGLLDQPSDFWKIIACFHFRILSLNWCVTNHNGRHRTQSAKSLGFWRHSQGAKLSSSFYYHHRLTSFPHSFLSTCSSFRLYIWLHQVGKDWAGIWGLPSMNELNQWALSPSSCRQTAALLLGETKWCVCMWVQLFGDISSPFHVSTLSFLFWSAPWCTYTHTPHTHTILLIVGKFPLYCLHSSVFLINNRVSYWFIYKVVIEFQEKLGFFLENHLY